jgi:uncharacterized membrane protein
MDNKILAAAVVGAAVVGGAVTFSLTRPPASPAMGEGASMTEAKGKEQCYGVAKAGENGCAAANGSHTCGGLSTIDNSGQEWMLVDADSCLKMGGKLEPFEDPPSDPAAPDEDAVKGG